MAVARKNKTQFKTSSRTSSRRDSSFLRSPRGLWFGLALLLFAVNTFIAHRQAPRPDPFQPVQTFSWDWWQYPLERNALKHLPVITSHLNDIFALPNSEKVWAVGGDGLIVHSKNSRQTWEQQQDVDWDSREDSQLTRTSATQERQKVESTQAIDAGQLAQNSIRSNIAQKGLNRAPDETNPPGQMPAMPPSARKNARRLISVCMAVRIG